MGFFFSQKKIYFDFFFSDLDAEDRIFLRWGYMHSPRGGGGRGGEKVILEEALSWRGGGREGGRGALSFSILGGGRGLREGGGRWRSFKPPL